MALNAWWGTLAAPAETDDQARLAALHAAVLNAAGGGHENVDEAAHELLAALQSRRPYHEDDIVPRATAAGVRSTGGALGAAGGGAAAASAGAGSGGGAAATERWEWSWRGHDEHAGGSAEHSGGTQPLDAVRPSANVSGNGAAARHVAARPTSALLLGTLEGTSTGSTSSSSRRSDSVASFPACLRLADGRTIPCAMEQPLPELRDALVWIPSWNVIRPPPDRQTRDCVASSSAAASSASAAAATGAGVYLELRGKPVVLHRSVSAVDPAGGDRPPVTVAALDR